MKKTLRNIFFIEAFALILSLWITKKPTIVTTTALYGYTVSEVEQKNA